MGGERIFHYSSFFGGGGVPCEISGGVRSFEEVLCSVCSTCSELEHVREQENR